MLRISPIRIPDTVWITYLAIASININGTHNKLFVPYGNGEWCTIECYTEIIGVVSLLRDYVLQ